MFFLNGRLTSLKRLFSLEVCSLVNKKNYHISIVNLNKKRIKKINLTEENVDDNVKDLEKLKKFTFVSFESRQKPAAKQVNKTPKIENKKTQRDNTELHKHEHIKLEQSNETKSAVEKLAILIDKLEPAKVAQKLLEPIETHNSNDKLEKLKKTRLKDTEMKNTLNKSKNSDATFSLNKIKQKKQVDSTEINKESSRNSKSNMKNKNVPKTNDLIKEAIADIKSRQKTSPDDRKALDKFIKTDTTNKNNYEKLHLLNDGIGLNLFEDLPLKTNQSKKITLESPIWEMYYDELLQNAQDILPINGFDEMIMLTNEGKIWNFPIDNEQGIDENEIKVSFDEHVFLDNYLEEFPDLAPVQEFMTLILNGLSKNGFLSVGEKKDIINWYKKYFEDKKALIEEALNAEKLEAAYFKKQEEAKTRLVIERQNKHN